MDSVSAALIVRNEASEIEACLDALTGCDEIVVVDTGSIDGTPEMVRAWALGHRPLRVVVSSFAWIDDFSAARNFAASLCDADWILHIDADMRPAPDCVARLREALSAATGRTMAVMQESISGATRNRRVLCHRPGVRWSGAIHEAMELDDGETAGAATILYGWSQSHSYDPERNLRILRREADRDPSPRTCYYLGAELWDRGKTGEAAGWFEKCAATTGWRAERADAWLYLAKIRWRQNRGEEAREAALRCLLNTPDCKEALELMATMSWPAEAAVWTRYAATAGNEGVIFARSPARSPRPVPA
jgi:glycosyltransferase involved in cell wall biosynthesis